MKFLTTVVIVFISLCLNAQDKLQSIEGENEININEQWVKESKTICYEILKNFVLRHSRVNYSLKGELTISKLENGYEIDLEKLNSTSDVYKIKVKEFLLSKLYSDKKLNYNSNVGEFKLPIDIVVRVKKYMFKKSKWPSLPLRFKKEIPEDNVASYFEKIYKDSEQGIYKVSYFKSEMNGKKVQIRQQQDEYKRKFQYTGLVIASTIILVAGIISSSE